MRTVTACLILLSTTLAGCPKSGGSTGASTLRGSELRYLVDHVAGVWKAPDGSRHYIVAFTPREPVVTQVVGPGAEPCQIDGYGVEGEVFAWHYTVPSTDVGVDVRVTGTGKGTLDVAWRDTTGASGSWTLVPF